MTTMLCVIATPCVAESFMEFLRGDVNGLEPFWKSFVSDQGTCGGVGLLLEGFNLGPENAQIFV
jgi:hypothetical protein